ncbi:MAG: HAMP domain-containing histidine kinase, partial [Psychrosphaera sp.]|nr:HAMP domain-containing histidine kinase [Psychrosphaera sp.]
TAICQINENTIEISISDNGGGMSEQTKNKLFEPFYTTKETGKGTGLGLSTSFGIIKRHNGTLSVESELGSGSVFYIRLPS